MKFLCRIFGHKIKKLDCYRCIICGKTKNECSRDAKTKPLKGGEKQGEKKMAKNRSRRNERGSW